MDSCKIEIYECPVLFSVFFFFFFFFLFRVPVSLALFIIFIHCRPMKLKEEKNMGFSEIFFLEIFNNRCRKPARLHWLFGLLQRP